MQEVPNQFIILANHILFLELSITRCILKSNSDYNSIDRDTVDTVDTYTMKINNNEINETLFLN